MSRGKNEDKFRGKKILAPMVRIGTLPMRLLCLDYDCDLAYTEETIAKRFLNSQRIVNRNLDTIDFLEPGERFPLFRSCAKEKEKVVFQMATCDPEEAVKAAAMVQNDVSAIDVNMGCPKSFSLDGNMGAALLTQPILVEQILTALCQTSSVPVTCKIRVLPNIADTLELCRLIERTGVSALAVHGRTKDERPRHPNHDDIIRNIAESLTIPVIANGGSSKILVHSDLEQFRTTTAASSVMIARAAQWNPSIFRKNGPLELDEQISAYIRYAVDYDSCPQNAKFVLQTLLRSQQQTERGQQLLQSGTLREICCAFDMANYYDSVSSKQREMRSRQERSVISYEAGESTETVEMCIPFVRKQYGLNLPKSIIDNYCKKRNLEPPEYKCHQRCGDHRFQGAMQLNGVNYISTFWERNKRYAEQSAALVAILHLEMQNLLPENVQLELR